jgi:hypothetical protein
MKKKLCLIAVLMITIYMVSYTGTGTAQATIRNMTVSISLNYTHNANIVHVGTSDFSRVASGVWAEVAVSNPSEAYVTSYSTANNILIGIIGVKANRITASGSGNFHTIGINQSMTGSFVMITFSEGDWRTIDNKLADIKSGAFMQSISPSFAYGLGLKYPIKIVLNMSRIDIQNKLVLNPGLHDLLLDYNTTGANGRPVFEITTL